MVACAGEGGALEQVGANGCGAEAGAGGGSGADEGTGDAEQCPAQPRTFLGVEKPCYLHFLVREIAKTA